MKQFRCGDVVPGCQWVTRNDDEQTLFGVSVAETRAFAMKALERRMKVIGLLQAA